MKGGHFERHVLFVTFKCADLTIHHTCSLPMTYGISIIIIIIIICSLFCGCTESNSNIFLYNS